MLFFLSSSSARKCPNLDTDSHHYFYTRNGTQERVHICAWVYYSEDCGYLKYVLHDNLEPIPSIRRFLLKQGSRSFDLSTSVASIVLNKDCRLEAYEFPNYGGFLIQRDTHGKYNLEHTNQIGSVKLCKCNFNDTDALLHENEVETILTDDDLKSKTIPEICLKWTRFIYGFLLGVLLCAFVAVLFIYRTIMLSLLNRIPCRIVIIRAEHGRVKI
uniref:Uncharacterized protein n=1 Tax=Acrobeloides nanus TaxID=290746 RepID=A0A914C9D0_9BILA